MKEGRKPEYPEKTPSNELQKMPHSLQCDSIPFTVSTKSVEVVIS